MKKIILFLFLLFSISALAQVDSATAFKLPYNAYMMNKEYIRNQLTVGKKTTLLDTLFTPNIALKVRDTSNLKLIVIDASGNHFKTNWPSSGISSITADNGLTASTSTNVQLGGTLLGNTTINSSTYYLKVTGNPSTNGAIFGESTGSQAAIWASNTGSGVGIYGISKAGAPLRGERDDAGTNTVTESLMIWGSSTGTPANGFGTKTLIQLKASDGSIYTSNETISKWTDATAATRTSQFIITGVNSGTTGDIAYFNGNGMVGIGSSTASATRLNVVDNSLGGANLVAISSTSTGAASNTQTALNISLSGANATGSQVTYGAQISNSHSGTSPTNYGLKVTTDNGSFANVAIQGADINSGVGVLGSSSSGSGLYGQSSSGYGVQAESQSGVAANITITNPASTNTVMTVLQLGRNTSGTAANGIGGQLEFLSETDAGGSTKTTNQLISKWTTATDATRTSQFKITGVLSASTVDVFTANSDGSWQIRPITATAASAITPAEGMMLFVSNTNGTFTSIGFWGYQNGAWHAF